MKPISPLGLPIGLTMTIWSVIGFLRFLQERFFPELLVKKSFKLKKTKKGVLLESPALSSIACILAAHNEEVIITRTIESLKKVFRPSQIYVASDGSTDKTPQLARRERVHVEELIVGRGKAKALIYLIKKYKLYKNYRFIFIIDADTQLDESFIPGALKMFHDPEIKVVYAAPHIHWPNHLVPRLQYYFIAYRERLNQILRYMMQYGQTWKKTNVTYVIPGFCTVYRSETLKKIPYDTPGLLIEDFNAAFYFHKHKLGKVGFHPSLIAWDQHPTNLTDYWNQVKRWNVGFFQTVRLNGVWSSWFWVTLAIFSWEVIANSIFLIFLPITLFFLIFPYFGLSDPEGFNAFQRGYLSLPIIGNVSLWGLYVQLFIIDYIFTVVIGWSIKKPQFVVYGLFFFFLHIVTSLILIVSIFPGFFGKSQGKWVSPTRHTIGMENEKM